MTDLITEQVAFAGKQSRLSAAKAAQKAALVALGRTPTDVWDTYPDELRAVTGGSGTYQDSKTVTADPAGMTILPDEGYSGMLKAIIAAEPNFQPWNLVDGIEAWGITGTAKPAVSTAPPTNLPVDKDDADTAYGEQTGAAPTETDYFVCVDNDGNITYWYLSDDFTITSYDPITTEFKATGAIRMAYHTTGESVGTWTLDDFTSAESGGWNYLKNIRSCTRDKLYYKGYEVWPDDSEYRASLGGGTMLYNGVELPNIDTVWTDKETYPYACIFDQNSNLYKTELFLALTSEPIYSDGTNFICPGKSIRYFIDVDSADVTDHVWGHSFISNSDYSLFSDDMPQRFYWSNYDLYLDGIVYLAASEPVKP